MKDLKLNNEKLNTGFKTPEGYFEQFESKMMDKIVNTNPEPKVVHIFYKKQIWISAIAAVFVAMFAIPYYFNSGNNSIETSTLESYLVHEFSTYELADKLSEDDIKDIEVDITYNDEALENYLLETQNIDYYLNN